MATTKQYNFKKLALSLVFDAIGMLSLTLPIIGSFSDIIWAPIAAWLMIRMYKGKAGQTAGAITFVEEILPGMDVVPTFTLMWCYVYLYKGVYEETTVELD